jgi:hypothetical protein
MPNDAASISMFSDRISRNTTLIALPITITFRKVLSSNRKHFGVSKVPLSFEQRKVFFEKCSEAEVTSSRSKHLDPILCLGPRWNMMINDNIDVHNGIANGTTAEFVKAYLKPGAKLVPIQMFGYWVYSVTVDKSTS